MSRYWEYNQIKHGCQYYGVVTSEKFGRYKAGRKRIKQSWFNNIREC